MTSSTDRNAIAGYYDAYSTWYEDERRDGYYGIINRLEVEALAPYAEGKRVLEVGCGTGLILERTAPMASEAIGIDLSPGMVEVTRGKGLEAVNASVNGLPFEDDSFDLVYSCKVLPHVPDIKGALLEIERVLAPGGRAILEFYNPRSFKALTYRIRTRLRRGEPVFVRHDDLDAVRSFLPPGWEVEAVRGIRTLGPLKQCYELPLLGSLLGKLEARICDRQLGQRFGGYSLIRLRPPT